MRGSAWGERRRDLAAQRDRCQCFTGRPLRVDHPFIVFAPKSQQGLRLLECFNPCTSQSSVHPCHGERGRWLAGHRRWPRGRRGSV